MKTARTKSELRNLLDQPADVGFVPTMGALHSGHLSLVEESKRRGLLTVVSIFVNPTQFNDKKDYDQYPVDIDRDLAMLKKADTDVVFLPSREEMYIPDGSEEKYIHDFGLLEQLYEGAFRPGHFRGVGQIVHKLFEAVQPDVAFFGEKDFQQLQVIRKLVEGLKMRIEVVGMPTVREEDGLAMSSRNRRLSQMERAQSAVLYQALSESKSRLQQEGSKEVKAMVEELFDQKSEMRLEYFEVINPETFQPIERLSKGEAAHAVIAAYAGDVRLIDNMRLA